jgi:hypothetical protein
MAKNEDAKARRSAIQDAKRHGESPSAAGATTGAAKQLRTVRHEHSEAKGMSKT